MDDLIVIILTLIIAGAGAIGQMKKKKRLKPEGEENQQKTTGDFWDFIDDLGGESQPANFTPPETETDAEPEGTPEFVKEQPKYVFKAEEERQSTFFKNDTVKDEIKEQLKKEKQEKISESFSLRKAVIYSEILNRKYT